MDARKWVAIGVLLLSLAPSVSFGQMGRRGGANARSQNFMVSTVDPEFAQQLLAQAEKSRRELAMEWFGKELPPAAQPVSLTAVDVGPQVLASGVTEFSFHGATPHSFQMVVAGSKERILDSVLPHEVLHTVFATFFGRPVIRWADEGCCTTVEHESERRKQDKLLIEFLHTDRGIAFNKMFNMKNYPRDMLPLYSQGYSLCRFLIHQGGKHKFMEYLREGMSREQWDAVTKKHYGYEDLSDLQVTWLEWVRNGSSDKVVSRIAGVGEESLVMSDIKPPMPTENQSAANGGHRVTASIPVTSSGAAVSSYEKLKNESLAKDLPKPIAGETRDLSSKGRSSSQTTARPFEQQKVQQRALSWGEGAVSTRPAPASKPIPSVAKPGGYEAPNYREAVQSASGWARTSSTKLR